MSFLQWYQTAGCQQEYETVMHANGEWQRTQPEQTDMKISQMMSGKYFKKEDVDEPTMLTIDRFEEENVAKDGQAEDPKWVMYFRDAEKGLVMNTTNLQLAAIAFGSQDTDDWIGRQIVLYHDPNVSFAGKLVGGVRVRGPKKPKAKPQVNPDPRPDPDDDVPF